jgi:hypothetical protein
MGIRIKESPSGREIVGTANGQILVWNDTTKRWDVGLQGEGLGPRGSVEKTGTTIVPGATGPSSTTGAPGPENTALAVCGQSTFPVGSKAIVNLMSKLGPAGAGLVNATVTAEYSIDSGGTWTPLSLDQGAAIFTAAGINDPMSNCASVAEVPLAGAPSFMLRLVMATDSSPDVAFNDPRLSWVYSAG